jgi:signal peptidase I
MARAATRSRGAKALLTLLALSAAALVAAHAFVAEPLRVVSSSMEPTLKAGDSVLVDKLGAADPRRGELVAFRAPDSDEILVKRVVALAGDRVAIEDGELVVNGRRRDEPYADPRAIDSVFFGPVEVPDAAVFVLGDNRGDSVDSRDFGAVREDAVLGRVGARLWPPARWGTPQ